nr:13927_t:CDS:2 [Entrophospora candida]
MYMDEILLYADKARLDSDQIHLLFYPPCKLHSQITEFISPNSNNVNSIDIPKSQNAFLLYRKNYAANHKSLESKKDWKILSKEAGDAWKNESNKVKSYFKTNAVLQPSEFNITTNLNNGENLLGGFQQYLQTEQTDAQLYETCLTLLIFVTRKIKI